MLSQRHCDSRHVHCSSDARVVCRRHRCSLTLSTAHRSSVSWPRGQDQREPMPDGFRSGGGKAMTGQALSASRGLLLSPTNATGEIECTSDVDWFARDTWIHRKRPVADVLHLVKVPLRPDKLVTVARSRGLPLRVIDEGYLCHCVSRELWQASAPAPFVLRERGRMIELWGYSAADAALLIDHALAYGDPALVSAVAGLDGIVSKPMPRFEAGRRLGFVLRACPVVRLAVARRGHAAGAEIDAFLAQCFAAGDEPVSREEVYRDWLTAQINREETGVKLAGVRVVGMSRQRLFRRTQAPDRRGRRLERPDVRFEGDVLVCDGDRLRAWLAHGVGRHRAFGFGALILAPPRNGPVA